MGSDEQQVTPVGLVVLQKTSSSSQGTSDVENTTEGLDVQVAQQRSDRVRKKKEKKKTEITSQKSGKYLARLQRGREQTTRPPDRQAIVHKQRDKEGEIRSQGESQNGTASHTGGFQEKTFTLPDKRFRLRMSWSVFLI